MLRFVWEGLKIMSLLPIHRMERNTKILCFQKNVGEEATLGLFVCVVIICQRRGRTSGSWYHHCLSSPLPPALFIWVILWKNENFLKRFYFLIMCMHVSMCRYMHMITGLQRPEMTDSFGAGVIGLL